MDSTQATYYLVLSPVPIVLIASTTVTGCTAITCSVLYWWWGALMAER